VACPGPLDYKLGLIGNTVNIPIIAHKNLKYLINKYFNIHINNIVIENDANVFALGEYINMKKKYKVSISITLGTGLGMGLIVDGKIFKGGNGRGPEYSLSKMNGDHNWEYYLGTQYFTRLSREHFNTIFSPKELGEKALLGDNVCIKIWKHFGLYLGKYLSHVINIFDPNLITIGGGISKSNSLFFKYILEYLKDNCILYDKNKCSILISENLLDSSYIGGYHSILFKKGI
jgi:glucokinase